jgi:hypothetical protein
LVGVFQANTQTKQKKKPVKQLERRRRRNEQSKKKTQSRVAGAWGAGERGESK